jgi:hypothetical protein
MLVSFFTLYKETSLHLEANAYATLPLDLPIRFNLQNYLNKVVSDSYKPVELKNHPHMILNEEITVCNFFFFFARFLYILCRVCYKCICSINAGS